MSVSLDNVQDLKRERTDSDPDLKKLDEEKTPASEVEILETSDDGPDEIDSGIIQKAEDVALKVCV